MSEKMKPYEIGRMAQAAALAGWVAVSAAVAGCAYTDPIHRMAEMGNIGGIERYLRDGGDINQPTKTNWVSGGSADLRPLHFAVIGEQAETVDYLLQRGADIEARSQRGRPLYLATNLAVPGIMALLLERGAGIEQSTDKSETLLHLAIDPRGLSEADIRRTRSKSRRADAAKVLLDHGLAADARDRNGRTPLMRAAARWNLPAMELLLRHGADINAVDNAGANALFGVSTMRFERSEQERQEELATFSWLLRHGADTRRIAGSGNSLLHAVCNTGIARLLLAEKPDVNLGNGHGDTPLHYAAGYRGCGPDLIRILVEAGADPDARNLAGITPLHAALHRETNLEKIGYLLERSRNPDARDNNGVSLLHVAALHPDQYWAIDTLAHKGAAIDATDKSGCTPLHWAVYGKSRRTVEALLKAGADPNARNERGETPLHIAAATAERSALHLDPLLDGGARRDIGDAAGYYPFHVAARAYRNEAAAERLVTTDIANKPVPDNKRPSGGCDASLFDIPWI